MIPLSCSQRGLWFLHQFGEEDTAYNVPLVWHFDGEVDRDALGAALRDVVIRHESLRTIFAESDGEVCQRVVRARDVGSVLSTYPVERGDVRTFVDGVIAQPFDLRVDLPIRAELLVVEGSADVLVVVTHHIATDGWSEDVFRRDLGTAYTARVSDTDPQWTELPTRYADYALWQQELLGERSEPGSVMAEQLAHRTAVLANLSDEPATRGYSSAETDGSRTGLVTFALDADVHARLDRITRRVHRPSRRAGEDPRIPDRTRRGRARLERSSGRASRPGGARR